MISLAGLEGHGLGDDSAQRREIGKTLHFPRVSKGSRSDEDRVGQFESTESYGKLAR